MPPAKAEPCSDGGSASGTTALRRGEKPAAKQQLQPERGARIPERSSPAAPTVHTEGAQEVLQAPEQRLPPAMEQIMVGQTMAEQTMVGQVVPAAMEQTMVGQTMVEQTMVGQVVPAAMEQIVVEQTMVGQTMAEQTMVGQAVPAAVGAHGGAGRSGRANM